ncbi:MAG TPA: FMN-binding protein [Solirubrobacteraceae bacterium]|jgi:uncharacterized protein with FMN-binding domain|nr:FMN-binding protein [Solirubrobacteraceae bacterium]
MKTPSRTLTAALALTTVGPAVAATPVAIAASSKTYHGSAVHMQWGTVQVKITVSGRRVTGISATAPTERSRSASINGRAVPVLRSEALRAQSSRINSVSGATLTSRAFDSSLQYALTKAHL